MGEESERAWLPKHLLNISLHKLVSVLGFGAVRKERPSLAMQNKFKFVENKCCRQIPLLMVPSEDNSDGRRSLYSITDNKLYDFQLQVPYKKRLSGSSHGWLITVEENFGLTIINPFSGATIQLPPVMDRSTFEPQKIDVEYFVTKVTLSNDPTLSPNDYIATAIYGDCQTLAFIRAGDEAWTYIDKKRFQIISDVIYYKGQIFAVNDNGRILMIDVNRRAGESMAPQVEVIAPDTNVYSQPMYLVESSRGDLLVVYRFLEYDDDSQHTTSGFKVFKLLLDQFEQGWRKQVEVKSLDGDTLFLGDNHSICVSASKWPGCQANSIYYTDHYSSIHFHPPSGRRDNGIFNIENVSFGTHYILDPSHKHMPPSIWIVPTTVFHKPLLSRI